MKRWTKKEVTVAGKKGRGEGVFGERNLLKFEQATVHRIAKVR